jgi:16S rRNA (cytidine1402-2'-O)-methyltransferase
MTMMANSQWVHFLIMVGILTQNSLKCVVMTESSPTTTGTLYVVATPIGNLADITHRAVAVLQSCEWVACEDTRHSKRLFQEYNITSKTIALHQHNEHSESRRIITLLESGQDVALVSDAGTPLISDPGFPLLQLAHQAGIRVSPIPGPSALTALLSVAAISTQPVVFHGFSPARSSQRQRFFEQLKPLDASHVFYESSHRILASVEQLNEVLGAEVVVAMGREISKRFEHIFRGTAGQLLELIQNDANQQKGEFVLAIEAVRKSQQEELDAASQSLALALNEHLPPKLAAKIVADHQQVNKKQVYQFILHQTAN